MKVILTTILIFFTLIDIIHKYIKTREIMG